jgi:hypothetical protein
MRSSCLGRPGFVWPMCNSVAFAHLLRASVQSCASNFTHATWLLTVDRSQLAWRVSIGFRQKAPILGCPCCKTHGMAQD